MQAFAVIRDYPDSAPAVEDMKSALQYIASDYDYAKHLGDVHQVPSQTRAGVCVMTIYACVHCGIIMLVCIAVHIK